MKNYFLIWLISFILIVSAIYFLIPKYDFIGDAIIRCNQITGKCETRISGHWENVIK